MNTPPLELGLPADPCLRKAGSIPLCGSPALPAEACRRINVGSRPRSIGEAPGVWSRLYAKLAKVASAVKNAPGLMPCPASTLAICDGLTGVSTTRSAVNFTSKLRVHASPASLIGGTNGGGTFFCSRSFQLIELKNGCDFTAAAPLGPHPSRLLIGLLSSSVRIDLVGLSIHLGSLSGAVRMLS